MLRAYIRRWIEGPSRGWEEARFAPFQFVQLCNQPTRPGNLAEIVSFAPVDLVASEMTDLFPVAGKESIGLPVAQGFAARRPEPIDI